MRSDNLDLFAWPDDPESIGVVMEAEDVALVLEASGLHHLIPPDPDGRIHVHTLPPTVAKVGQCRFCLHAESDHQKGGETMRSSMRFVPGVVNSGGRAPFPGTNRYCHEALCSCTHYHHAHCACPTRLVACVYVLDEAQTQRVIELCTLFNLRQRRKISTPVEDSCGYPLDALCETRISLP
jgi:hypothetical protein